MITSLFIQTFFYFINLLIGLLPTVSSNTNISTAISTASNYVSSIHAFLPYITTTAISIIGLFLVFEGGYMLFKIIYWIIKRFPTQS